jgi:hypothetical protein
MTSEHNVRSESCGVVGGLRSCGAPVVTFLVGVCRCSVEREGRGWWLAVAATACGVLVSLLLFFVPAAVVVVVLCGGVHGALRGQKSCGLSRCCRGYALRA